MPYHKAIRVKALKQYLILIEFDNHEKHIFNCYKLFKEDKLFSELEDETFFKTVHIDDSGLVCWNRATDVHPGYLYEESQSIEEFSFE